MTTAIEAQMKISVPAGEWLELEFKIFTFLFDWYEYWSYLLLASGVCAVFKESTYILCHTEGDKSRVCQGITLAQI